MKKTKVTVGVCVRNCEKTIEEAFSSILNQDFPHELLKIIVVDGNSTDRTIPIITKLLSKTDIQFRMLSDNGEGLGKARSVVVDCASGKYIIWVDGDIVLPGNHISKQVEFMEQNSNVGSVRGRMRSYKGENLCALLESLTNISKFTQPPLCAGGSTFRLEAIKQVGNYNPSIRRAGEDIEIAFRMKTAGWLFSINHEVTHINRETWKELWNERFWWGYGGHYINHKYPRSIVLWHELPIVALAFGALRAFRAYKITHLKASFLLPLQNAFTGMAWLSGFVKSHIDGYEPKHST